MADTTMTEGSMRSSVIAHSLTALALTALMIVPATQAHADAEEARQSARTASRIFNEKGIFVVDQASGVVPHRGTGDYVTFMTAGVKYFILVSGDSSVRDIGVSVWGPKKSNDRFRLVAHEGLRSKDKVQLFRLIAIKPKVSGLYLVRLHLINGSGSNADVYTLIGLGS